MKRMRESHHLSNHSNIAQEETEPTGMAEAIRTETWKGPDAQILGYSEALGSFLSLFLLGLPRSDVAVGIRCEI